MISAGRQRFAVHRAKSPGVVPWRDYGVDGVLESTGIFTRRAALDEYHEAGVPRVLVSGPAPEADFTVVYGVNHAGLAAAHRSVSNASCTTNCLAPLVKVLHEKFILAEAFMTTVHTYTNSQTLLDAPVGRMRRNRAAALNIIPTSTSADHVLEQVYPAARGRVRSLAMRVPAASVSLCDLTARLENPPASAEALHAAFSEAAAGPLRGVLAVEDAPLVSCDFRGNPHSSIVDAGLTQLRGGLAKVVAWYDNEWGYVCRLLDVLRAWPRD
jgi:glyceraldehyde 3-phosphate dehydrogenase